MDAPRSPTSPHRQRACQRWTDAQNYREAQRARLKKARLEGGILGSLRPLAAAGLIRTGDEPWLLLPIAGGVTLIFAVAYAVVGGLGTGSPGALFLFSLITLLSGTVGFLTAVIPYGENLLGAFAPFARLLQQESGIAAIEPTTETAQLLVAVEGLLGVLLLVPFLLLLLRLVKSYLRADQGSESVFLAWLSER